MLDYSRRLNWQHHASEATVKQGGQSDHTVRSANPNMTQYRTVHHQSHLGTRTQFVDYKQATPTAFDPCPPAGVPKTIHAIYTDPPPAVVTDELTPSK
jgi:hypothetical protein